MGRRAESASSSPSSWQRRLRSAPLPRSLLRLESVQCVAGPAASELALAHDSEADAVLVQIALLGLAVRSHDRIDGRVETARAIEHFTNLECPGSGDDEQSRALEVCVLEDPRTRRVAEN